MDIFRTTCLSDNAFLIPIAGPAWTKDAVYGDPTYNANGVILGDYVGTWAVPFTRLSKFRVQLDWTPVDSPGGAWNCIFGDRTLQGYMQICNYFGETEIRMGMYDPTSTNGVMYKFPSTGITAGVTRTLRFELDASAPAGSKVKFFINGIEQTAVFYAEAGTGDWGTASLDVGMWNNQDTWEGSMKNFSIDEGATPVVVSRKYGLRFHTAQFPVGN